MFKKINKKGFTLAELLIVVAIIGVLVAISIPIFTAQLRKARLATNQANARAAYAEAVAKMLDDKNTATSFEYTVKTATIDTTTETASGNTAISDWGVDTTINTKQLGDLVAEKWIVTFTAATTTTDASIAGISATWPSTP
ncbi:prepilin-type N-terminal cleavage/methylation domain-containing protein [Lachnospiraceae bacterium JC7]|nr:prepilin-type N-terminal cleavage/methylation domain-containing protein [Lachnospiraceae bacterium JC7]